MSKKDIKIVAVCFANFLKDKCMYNINGYIIIDELDKGDEYEYQIDELFDYWFENIFHE